jgi:hypothetical protein
VLGIGDKDVEHLERMKHGNGIKDREDKLSGIQMLIAEVFAKVNPTEPLRLVKRCEGNEIDPIPLDLSNLDGNGFFFYIILGLTTVFNRLTYHQVQEHHLNALCV